MARAIVTQYGMSPLGTQVFGQPNHEVFLGRDYGNTQDYSEETARRIDEEVSKIMKEAHDRAHKILSEHAEQMDLMASVLLARETVEGEACQALLDNKWDEYLERESEIIAMHEREEAEARKRDLETHPELTESDIKGTDDPNAALPPRPEDRVAAPAPTASSASVPPAGTAGAPSVGSSPAAPSAAPKAEPKAEPERKPAPQDDEHVRMLNTLNFNGVVLADPDWKEARVEPGDQDPNGPYRKAAENADLTDEPTQDQVDAEIAREDLMDSSPLAPNPLASEDPFTDDNPGEEALAPEEQAGDEAADQTSDATSASADQAENHAEEADANQAPADQAAEDQAADHESERSHEDPYADPYDIKRN